MPYCSSRGLMRQGRLHTDGLISHRIPAAESLGVWDALAGHQQDYLGVILVWDGAGA